MARVSPALFRLEMLHDTKTSSNPVFSAPLTHLLLHQRHLPRRQLFSKPFPSRAFHFPHKTLTTTLLPANKVDPTLMICCCTSSSSPPGSRHPMPKLLSTTPSTTVVHGHLPNLAWRTTQPQKSPPPLKPRVSFPSSDSEIPIPPPHERACRCYKFKWLQLKKKMGSKLRNNYSCITTPKNQHRHYQQQSAGGSKNNNSQIGRAHV